MAGAEAGGLAAGNIPATGLSGTGGIRGASVLRLLQTGSFVEEEKKQVKNKHLFCQKKQAKVEISKKNKICLKIFFFFKQEYHHKAKKTS